MFGGAIGQRVEVQVLITDGRIRDGSKYSGRQRPVGSQPSGDDTAEVLDETSPFRPILTVIPTRGFRRQIVARGKDKRQCFGMRGLRPVENSANRNPVTEFPLRGCSALSNGARVTRIGPPSRRIGAF